MMSDEHSEIFLREEDENAMKEDAAFIYALRTFSLVKGTLFLGPSRSAACGNVITARKKMHSTNISVLRSSYASTESN